MSKPGPRPKGCIIPRPGKRYQAQIRIDGRLHSQTFTSREAAQAYLRRLRGAALRPDRAQELIEAEKLTLGEVISKRIAEVDDQAPSAAKKRSALRRLLRTAEKLCALRVNEIMPIDVQDYLRSRQEAGDAPATIRGDVSRISKCFRWAQQQGCPDLPNPARAVDRPKTTKDSRSLKYRRLSQSQEEALLVAADALQREARTRLPMAALIRFALATTMRLGEIAALEWDDVDWHRHTVHVGHSKNGDERIVPVAPSTLELLESLVPEDSGRIWGAMSTIARAWREARVLAAEALEREGKRAAARKLRMYRFHDLRFEGICRLFEQTTLNEREIAAISGHRTPTMLWHYARKLRRESVAAKLAQAEGQDWRYDPGSPSASPPLPPAVINPAWRSLRCDPVRLRAAVWSMPVRDLAADMGVSDVAVHKACARLGVEKPPMGYWLQQHRRAS